MSSHAGKRTPWDSNFSYRYTKSLSTPPFCPWLMVSVRLQLIGVAKTEAVRVLMGTRCLGGLFMWCQLGRREWRLELEVGTVFKVHPRVTYFHQWASYLTGTSKRVPPAGDQELKHMSWAWGEQFMVTLQYHLLSYPLLYPATNPPPHLPVREHYRLFIYPATHEWAPITC